MNASSPVSASDGGRFALALWEGGDLDGGDRIVEGLGEIDKKVADELNAFLARYQAALKDHQEGRNALLDGRDEPAASRPRTSRRPRSWRRARGGGRPGERVTAYRSRRNSSVSSCPFDFASWRIRRLTQQRR